MQSTVLILVSFLSIPESIPAHSARRGGIRGPPGIQLPAAGEQIHRVYSDRPKMSAPAPPLFPSRDRDLQEAPSPSHEAVWLSPGQWLGVRESPASFPCPAHVFQQSAG